MGSQECEEGHCCSEQDGYGEVGAVVAVDGLGGAGNLRSVGGGDRGEHGEADSAAEVAARGVEARSQAGLCVGDAARAGASRVMRRIAA